MGDAKGVTRRGFLRGSVGGAALLGCHVDGSVSVGPPAGWTGPVERRVVVLGAGLAGLSAARELARAGFEIRVLEASMRCGGRCWTLRRGDQVHERGREAQRVEFDEGLYWNAGASRFPANQVTLDLCRELKLDVEVFTFRNPSAYLLDEPRGQIYRIRELLADLHGHEAAALAQALREGALPELSASLRARWYRRLAQAGDLDGDPEQPQTLRYTGTARRGYLRAPTSEPGEIGAPLPLDALLHPAITGPLVDDRYRWHQAPMFQIVGGNDRLPRALAAQLGADRITYGARVDAIRSSASSVRVSYRDHGDTRQELEAAHCVCTIPLPILRTLDTDFTDAMRRAIDERPVWAAAKIGLQMSQRFWESEDEIYGGFSHAGERVREIWYPSEGYGRDKGILCGGYTLFGQAEATAARTHDERIEVALAEGARLHPSYRAAFETGASVCWQEIPHARGGFASPKISDMNAYTPALMQPQGRTRLAGEHVSYLCGWMAGAIESGRCAAGAIVEHAPR